jgi:acyl carrier protein
MDALIEELKAKIVETLNLEDVTPRDISTDGRLVGGDLGIDSIDVLEMVMMIERDYGVAIENRELGEKVLSSVRALALHIQANSTRRSG